jgi:hypothetical protein
MKKHLLILTILLFSGISAAIASTGSITITSPAFPANIEAGGTLAVSITYTSDVNCKMNYGIFLTNANDDTPNWSTWKSGGSIDLTAATDSAIVLNLEIPGDFNTANLEEGIDYILALSLNDGADFAWNNAGNIIKVGASSVAVNTVNFITTPPAVVHPGDKIVIDYEYTIAEGDSNQVKVSITEYTSSGTWVGDLVAAYPGLKANTGTTPVQASDTLTIPEDATLSSELTSGNVYKMELGIYTGSWGYLMSNKLDVSVEIATGIRNVEQENLSVYPNPTSGIIHLKGVEPGASIRIFNTTGVQVKQMLSVNPETINVSELSTGMYFLVTGDRQIKFIKQ